MDNPHAVVWKVIEVITLLILPPFVHYAGGGTSFMYARVSTSFTQRKSFAIMSAMNSTPTDQNTRSNTTTVKAGKELSRKPMALVVVAAALVLASWAVAFAWAQSQRGSSSDMLNRVEYSLSGSVDPIKYLEQDMGYSLEELLESEPKSLKTNSFPELYFIARSLGSFGYVSEAVVYYQAADTLLEKYHARDTVESDFYMSYMNLYAHVGSPDEVKSVADRALEAIDRSDVDDETKSYNKQLINGLVGADIEPEGEDAQVAE